MLMSRGQGDTGADDLRPRDAWLAGILLSLIALFSLTALMAAYYLPPQQGEVGVIFPPWVEQRDAFGAVVAAGGSIAGTGRFSNIVVAFAQNADFTRRILANGAWMVTAARGLCAPQPGVTL